MDNMKNSRRSRGIESDRIGKVSVTRDEQCMQGRSQIENGLIVHPARWLFGHGFHLMSQRPQSGSEG